MDQGQQNSEEKKPNSDNGYWWPFSRGESEKDIQSPTMKEIYPTSNGKIIADKDTNTIDLYDWGFRDGVLGLAKDFDLEKNYVEDYINASTESDYYKEIVRQEKDEIHQLKDKIEKTKEDKENSLKQLYESSQDILFSEAEKTKFQEKLKTYSGLIDLDTKEIKNDEIRRKYSISVLLLFLAAALTFLVADFVITRDIVSKALKINDWWEKLLFALGITSISFILKPAYDRLVEFPYVKNHKHFLFPWVITIVVLVTIVFLIVLGMSRNQQIQVEELTKKHKEIVKDIKDIELRIDGCYDKAECDDLEKEKLELEKNKKKQEEKIEKLEGVDNWSNWLAFILSTVLFPVACAILMGISFPELQKDYRVYQLKKKLKKEQDMLDIATINLSSHKKKFDTAFVTFSLLPDLDKLEDELKGRENSLSEKLKEGMMLEKQTSIAFYSNAYQHGAKTMELYGINWVKNWWYRYIKIIYTTGGTNKGIYKKYRPYVALRKKIIQDLYNKPNGITNNTTL